MAFAPAEVWPSTATLLRNEWPRLREVRDRSKAIASPTTTAMLRDVLRDLPRVRVPSTGVGLPPCAGCMKATARYRVAGDHWFCPDCWLASNLGCEEPTP